MISSLNTLNTALKSHPALLGDRHGEHNRDWWPSQGITDRVSKLQPPPFGALHLTPQAGISFL